MDSISLLNVINAEDGFYNKSFEKNWDRYLKYILEFLGTYPNKDRIIRLHGILVDFFNPVYT
jgi:hypothetical protein